MSLTFNGVCENSPFASILGFWHFHFVRSSFLQKYLTICRRVLSGGEPSLAFHRIRMDLILLLVIRPLGSLAFAFMVVLVNWLVRSSSWWRVRRPNHHFEVTTPDMTAAKATCLSHRLNTPCEFHQVVQLWPFKVFVIGCKFHELDNHLIRWWFHM